MMTARGTSTGEEEGEADEEMVGEEMVEESLEGIGKIRSGEHIMTDDVMEEAAPCTPRNIGKARRPPN